MPDALPSAVAVRSWDEGGKIIEIGEVYAIVSESNSEWTYVLDAESEPIGWVPSYCFDDKSLEERLVTKDKHFDESAPEFLALKANDTFKQIYRTTSQGDDLRYGFVKGTKKCGWVDALYLEKSNDETSTDEANDFDHQSVDTIHPSCLNIESIERFLDRFSLQNGVRYYLTKYLDHLNLKRYINAVDKICMLICDFSWYNHLDNCAYNLLFDVDPSISLKVMDHGFFIAAKNNSAVVTSRIRMFKREAEEFEWKTTNFQ